MPSNTTTTTSNTPISLTLPSSTFAKISPSSYLIAHLLPSDPTKPSLRPSGRSPTTSRPIALTTGSLTHCVGSAVVRTGATAIVCGIQAELLYAHTIPNPPLPSISPQHALAALNLLVPNVELATGCSPHHLPGGPPTSEAQTLTARLLTTLLHSNLIQLSDLLISKPAPDSDDSMSTSSSSSSSSTETVPAAYWTLHISMHVLSLSGSTALFDSAWAALLAALRDVRLPSSRWDTDSDSILCSPDPSRAHRLVLRGLPLACTVGVFVGARQAVELSAARRGEADDGGAIRLADGRWAWVLADPEGLEDELCVETVTVVSDWSGGAKVVRVEKSGGTVLGVKDVVQLCRPGGLVQRRWEQWEKALRVD